MLAVLRVEGGFPPGHLGETAHAGVGVGPRRGVERHARAARRAEADDAATDAMRRWLWIETEETCENR